MADAAERVRRLVDRSPPASAVVAGRQVGPDPGGAPGRPAGRRRHRLAGLSRLHDQPGPPARRDCCEVLVGAVVAHRGLGRTTRIGRFVRTNQTITASAGPATDQQDPRAGRRQGPTARLHHQPRPGRRFTGAADVAGRAAGQQSRPRPATHHSAVAARRQGVLLPRPPPAAGQPRHQGGHPRAGRPDR